MKKVILAVAALALMTGSAWSADWNFYGQARVSTFWDDTDEISGKDNDVQYNEFINANARLGARVKVSDTLIGRFEYGTKSDNANIRLLYGEWDFGSGKLKVGQDYTPLSWYYYSNMVYGNTVNGSQDSSLLGLGAVYSGRESQVCLTFGDFKIAFLDPSTDFTNNATVTLSTDKVIPAIEISYKLDLGDFVLDFGAGYNTFEVTTGTNDENVNSYVLAFGAIYNKANFYAKGDIFYGQNAYNLVYISTSGDDAGVSGDGLASVSDTGVTDNDCLGLLLVAGYTFNEKLTVEAGYGYTQTELDGSSDDDQQSTYYINATINLAPGVFIVPELGFIDGQEDGDMEIFYYGMKWQINF